MKKHSITILYNSPVILTFALLSLLALGLGKLTDGWTTQNLFCVYRSSLTDWLTYPRFFLHVLGHPDFAAYCSNIVMLLVVGPTAEERFGALLISAQAAVRLVIKSRLKTLPACWVACMTVFKIGRASCRERV